MRNPARAFLLSEFGLVAFALMLPFAFMIPSRSFDSPFVHALLYTLFLAMSFASGTLTGIQFPLSARLHLQEPAGRGREEDGVSRTAGLLYAADLLGGYVGGLIGGIVLLPLLGLQNSCFVLAMFKCSSLLVVLLHIRRIGINHWRG
jgi:spermidine synthase